MPDGLDTVLFTTSGTEANELAWRLATEWTGGTGALVVEHGYHGTTPLDGRPEPQRVAAGPPTRRRRHLPGAGRRR